MVSEVMLAAVDFLRHNTDFGELDIKILSEEEYRLPPEEHVPLGRWGADIEIDGVKVFLGHESMAEEILWYGKPVANQFLYHVLKEKYLNK